MRTPEFRLDRKIANARRRAAQTGQTQYVCEVDEGYEMGERALVVCDQRYVDSDEFVAFEGRVLHEVSPNGDVY